MFMEICSMEFQVCSLWIGDLFIQGVMLWYLDLDMYD